MKDSGKLYKRVSFIGIGLCAVCCLFPMFAVLLGMGALTLLMGFLEWAGIVSMLAAVVFFVIYFARRRKAPACEIDCRCKDEGDCLEV
jgi:hypothetical protein